VIASVSPRQSPFPPRSPPTNCGAIQPGAPPHVRNKPTPLEVGSAAAAYSARRRRAVGERRQRGKACRHPDPPATTTSRALTATGAPATAVRGTPPRTARTRCASGHGRHDDELADATRQIEPGIPIGGDPTVRSVPGSRRAPCRCCQDAPENTAGCRWVDPRSGSAERPLTCGAGRQGLIRHQPDGPAAPDAALQVVHHTERR
jgi:hypothetical protein